MVIEACTRKTSLTSPPMVIGKETRTHLLEIKDSKFKMTQI
jgi:hypothetical protein